MKKNLPNIEVDCFNEGCPKSFLVVFNFYYPIIVRYIHSRCPIAEDVEELTQEVFVQLHLSKEKINRVEDIYPLLFTIAKRITISYFRKQISIRNTHQEAQKNWSYDVNSTEETISFNELSKVLDNIIKSLPPQQRQVYELSSRDNLTNEKISDELNISKNTVRNHLRLATQNVRLSLSKIYNTLFL
ncbi:RNA polymerase sigma factor [Sphingobacterium bovisgrunnientis]|jgi:RNA polymerase sigma factor (sigma-70 family)|uniref:RNA polymerase sigma factor n=1 Tax=Sphingobacterium bovisgrunnientis TaxID=1874697 RepID=UPI001358AC86|nr:sigma-70 family RNA polymerase sigma factor [Sphingobacterium bovisgrunnientis]